MHAAVTIGAFVAASGVSVAAMRGPEPELERPSIAAIAFRGDTIFFCGELGGFSTHTSQLFAHVRSTGAWLRVTPAVDRCDGPVTRSADGTYPIALGRHASVDIVKPPTGEHDRPLGRAYLVLHDSSTHRDVSIRPRVSAELRRLTRGMDMVDTISTVVSAFAADDSVVWLGLSGGFPEGVGDAGGIVRVDRRTGAVNTFVDTVLYDQTISGLAWAPPWLFAGTEQPGEYGAFGQYGVLRYNDRRKSWFAYTDSNSALPDNLIAAAASHDSVIALATKKGFAIATIRAGENEPLSAWKTAYFVAGFSGDTLVWNVGSKAEAPLTPEDEAPILFVQRFAQPGRERPLFDLLRGIPRSKVFYAAFGFNADVQDSLADPVFAPALLHMLSGPDEARRVAAIALAEMGSRAPRGTVDSLRARFAKIDTSQHAGLARWSRSAFGRALTILGDSTAVRWARTTLLNATAPGPRNSEDIIAAAEIVSAIRDRGGLNLILANASHASETEAPSFAEAVDHYDDPAAWATLLQQAFAGSVPMRSSAIDALPRLVMRDPQAGIRVRNLLAAALRGDDELAGRAARAVGTLRIADLVPQLIALLAPDRTRMPWVTEAALVSLIGITGHGDAPLVQDGTLPSPAVHQWWKRVLDQAGGNIIPVSAEDGQRALDTWFRRRR